jgi:hypothetical protein
MGVLVINSEHFFTDCKKEVIMIDSTKFRNEVAIHMHRMSQISRDDIFGKDAEKCMPIGNPQDANTMFTGYVGKEYQPGGVLLIAKNPGGGGDDYKPTVEDSVLYPLLFNFKHANVSNAFLKFEAINEAFSRIAKKMGYLENY